MGAMINSDSEILLVDELQIPCLDAKTKLIVRECEYELSQDLKYS